MIELTVKTLDSQNHSFTVEDDITVEQFKAKIADTVNIPADTQRIIYCGRVLQDNAKLNDYDVNGKVVHLVQRPPPTANQRVGRSSTPPPVSGRRSRTLDGNAMYLGSMAFPSNLMESQGIVPPPPTHSLAGSRLNVARRMLRKAEAVVRLLENPSARPNEQPQPDDNQEEEVTPVIEARVLVPTNENEPIDEAMVLSAVQNSLFNVGAVNMNRRSTNETANAERARRSSEPSTTSTPDGQTPRSSSTENLTETRSDSAANVLAENASRTTEMAELLTMLNQLQVRFAPFLERYQTFMQEDPIVAAENVRSTQAMITRVSEVLHFLGHAYHSLSDIIVRVRTPPQRPLLCRPILIQHSAVVQAGIPIQVEAQINLSADRPPGFGTPPNTANGSAANPPTSTENSQTPTSTTSQQQARSAPAPNLGAFSFLPTAMRVQSFPVEIRTISRPTNPTARPQNNNNNTVDAADNANITSSTTANTTTSTTTTTTASGTNESNGSFNLNNPNLEFFMEVTPEGITIDSLETTLVGSANQANDLLRGALNGPSPEFRQALNRMIQVAGELFSRAGTPNAAPTTTAPSTDSTQSTTSVNLTGQSSSIGQNSQARGNTQTNPTTATHTRSTPRPHVHLAQQAMQGGFDPFLPCNSHHITPRRRIQAHTHQAGTQNSGTRTEGGSRTAAPSHNQNIYNIINGLVNSLNSVNARRNVNPAQNAPNNESATNGGINLVPPPLQSQSLLTMLPGMSLTDLMRFHLNQDGSYEPGESIFADLIVILIRNITMVDLLTFSNDLVEPIMRNHLEIQRFVSSRILNNATGAEAVDRGVDLVVQEMRPFLQNFVPMPVRDDIDVVRSAETLFRQRLPSIINLASTLTTNTAATSIRSLVDQVVTTLKHMCALILRASQNGQPGVEQIFEEIVNPFIQDLAPDIRNWTLVASRVHLRQFISNLNVPEGVLQPYIVRRSVTAPTPQLNVRPIEELTQPITKASNTEEAMELDEQEASSSNTAMCSAIIFDDAEPLPNIVLGSESWHSQVPEEWVPIIARDSQKQRRQNAQGPFSDAYLSGMPSKRRKIVTSSKPEGSLSQVISESVRQAVTATGLSSVAPLETVVQAAAASPEIQTAYTNLLRSNVQSSLRDNEDFTAERFPNVSTYFNNSSQQ